MQSEALFLLLFNGDSKKNHINPCSNEAQKTWTMDSLFDDRKRKGGLVAVFSLGSSHMVETEKPPARFRFQSGFRFNVIYKMPNKTTETVFRYDT